jgi:phosphate transport system ATP-binding protein
MIANGSEVQIRDLNLSIGKQKILNNINLDIPTKRLTVIIGPSGCGKTTLLKCLNRLTDLTPEMKIKGSITIGNTDILNSSTNVVSIRKKMGLLAQRPYPLPMSIFGNVAYGLKLSQKLSRKEIYDKVEHYLKLANLWNEVKDRLHEPAAKLSIGQQQRLCLARGLAVDPEIILADEPTSALDPISSQAIEEQFNLLKNDYTIIMVTHILRQAKRIADYVIFIYMGEVIETGTAEEFFNNPKKEKTRSYLQGLFN